MLGPRLSLRARIFTSMLLIIVVSFTLTGIISLYHFKEESAEYHQERLKRKEYAIESNIEYFLSNHPLQQHQDSLVGLFSDKICELSDVHNLDIVLYSPSGKLIISNNSSLLDKGWVSEVVPSEILDRVVEGERKFVQSSSDTTDVLLIYSILYTNEGKPLAILNLPYFESRDIPDNDRAFFQTLFTLYILLFFGAAVLAYFLSNYITHSLTAVASKMRKLQLGKHNEPIYWKSKDEIGELVYEYNRMMSELEQSAIKLAQSERETAWKEMAKQVAHEIKNPLTPMRLSVQMLERNTQGENAERMKEFTEGMIAQIDALSNIATAFSRFASMPEMNLENLNLKVFLERFKAAHDGIAILLPSDDVFVKIDRDQFTRVLNNLILNAQQAIPEGRQPKIQVSLECIGQRVLVKVSDNGSGIPEDRTEKVFEPSFTTKTQGMGLGLAMVKNIVQGFKGSIYFTSIVGEGTTFVVDLPSLQGIQGGDL